MQAWNRKDLCSPDGAASLLIDSKWGNLRNVFPESCTLGAPGTSRHDSTSTTGVCWTTLFYSGPIQRRDRNNPSTQNVTKERWLVTLVCEKTISETFCPGLPTHRSTTNKYVLSWLAWKLSGYFIVCALACSGTFPYWSARHLLMWFTVWCLCACWRPLRRLPAQAKGIRLCKESSHCDHFIKSNSFCNRNMEAKFTMFLKMHVTVCGCVAFPCME